MARSKCSFALRIAVPQGGSFTVSTLGALSTGCTRADTAVRLLKLHHIEVSSKNQTCKWVANGTRKKMLSPPGAATPSSRLVMSGCNFSARTFEADLRRLPCSALLAFFQSPKRAKAHAPRALGLGMRLELGMRLRHVHLRWTTIASATLASTTLASTALASTAPALTSTALASALATTTLTSTSLAATTTLAAS